MPSRAGPGRRPRRSGRSRGVQRCRRSRTDPQREFARTPAQRSPARSTVPGSKSVMSPVSSSRSRTAEVCRVGEPRCDQRRRRSLTATSDRSVLRCDGGDLAYISIEFIDADGVRDTSQDHLVEVAVDGAGVLQALGARARHPMSPSTHPPARPSMVEPSPSFGPPVLARSWSQWSAKARRRRSFGCWRRSLTHTNPAWIQLSLKISGSRVVERMGHFNAQRRSSRAVSSRR